MKVPEVRRKQLRSATTADFSARPSHASQPSGTVEQRGERTERSATTEETGASEEDVEIEETAGREAAGDMEEEVTAVTAEMIEEGVEETTEEVAEMIEEEIETIEEKTEDSEETETTSLEAEGHHHQTNVSYAEKKDTGKQTHSFKHLKEGERISGFIFTAIISAGTELALTLCISDTTNSNKIR